MTHRLIYMGSMTHRLIYRGSMTHRLIYRGSMTHRLIGQRVHDSGVAGNHCTKEWSLKTQKKLISSIYGQRRYPVLPTPGGNKAYILVI